MKKSFNSTLILVGVLVALSAWYLLYEKKFKSEKAEREENEKILLATPSESVQEITIEQRQGDAKKATYRTVKFKKTGTEWSMVAPVEDLAEMGAVSGLLNLVSSAKQERVVEEKPASLEPFGLDVPKIKITVRKDSQSEPETMLVGNDTPVGSAVYVKLPKKDTVFRGPVSLRSSFEKDPNEYRNKKILSLNKPDINEVEIRGPGEPALLKRTNEKWTLSRLGWPASDAEVNKVLIGLTDLRAVAIASDKASDAGKYGLTPPAYTVVLKSPSKQALLQLGKTKDKFFAKRGDRGTIYEIGKEAYEKVAQPATAYREKRMAEFNRFDVQRIQVEHGPQSYELVKEGEEWKLGSDLAVKLDRDKVEEYLTRLQDAQVDGYLAASAKPTKPDLVVRLFEGKPGEGKGTEKLALKFAKPAGGKAVGERTGLSLPFTLPEAEFKKINAFKQEFLASEKRAENKAKTGKS